MSKILVTGGAGFIGSEISHLLVSLGHEVVAFDNLFSGHMENINDLLAFENFTFIQGDVRNFDECLSASVGVDYIIHQAALVSVPKSIEEPILNNEINIKGFVNILEAARKNKIKRVVYASSSAVYGDNDDMVKVEEHTGKTISPYALSKLADEWYAGLYYRLYGLPTVGLRYFNVYGEKQDPSSVYSGVISIFFKKAMNDEPITIYGNGEVTRDFIYVNDVARANWQACIGDAVSVGQVYNIGTNQATTIKELAEMILKIANKNIPIIYSQERIGDIKYSCANTTKAKEQLNFCYRTSLVDGLKSMKKHLINHKK
jgi:UDP-N-acetylglucosamine 4-epimerase